MLLDLALKIVVPAIVGPLAYLISEGIQKAVGFLDKQGAAVKQVLTLAISTGLVQLAAVVPGLCPEAEPCTLENLSTKALASAGIALAVHGMKNQKKRKA